MAERIIAIGLLAKQGSRLVGPAFDQAWPVEEVSSFDELLRAIDEADLSLHKKGAWARRLDRLDQAAGQTAEF